jgi:outer membrane protein assembly factor BamB
VKTSRKKIALGLGITAGVVVLLYTVVIALVYFAKTGSYIVGPHPEPQTNAPNATWSQRLGADYGGIYQASQNEAVDSSPAIGDDGLVYVVTGGGSLSGTWRGQLVENFSTAMLTAVDGNGKKLWEFMPGNAESSQGDANNRAISTSPAIAGDRTIFIVRLDGVVLAFNPDGTKKWQGQIKPSPMPSSMGQVHAPPAIASDGTSYWPGNALVAFGADGIKLWEFAPGEPNFYAVSISRDGTIYARTANSIYAVRADGTQIWKHSLAAVQPCQDCTPALDAEGNIYVTAGRNLTVINPDGTLRWELCGTKQDEYQGTPLIGADGTIYVSHGADLDALRPDGKLKWSFAMWHEGQNFPAALGADGTIYVKGNRFRALTADGQLKWQVTGRSDSPSPWFTPVDPSAYLWSVALAADGKLYLGDHLGSLAQILLSHGLAQAPWPMPAHDARNTSHQ